MLHALLCQEPLQPEDEEEQLKDDEHECGSGATSEGREVHGDWVWPKPVYQCLNQIVAKIATQRWMMMTFMDDDAGAKDKKVGN